MHAALDDAENGRAAAAVECRPGPRRPTHRTQHGRARLIMVRGKRGALVQDHLNIAAELRLYPHAALGIQVHLRTVDRRVQLQALLADALAAGQAERLKAARIGQYRPLPAAKSMQTAKLFDQFRPRPQHQVKGVCQDDLGVQFAQVLHRHRAHRAVGPDRHESRSPHHTAGQFQPASPRVPAGRRHRELHAPCPAFSRSIASP